MTKGNKKKICFIATVEFAISVYLLNHIKVMSDLYDITVITNSKDPDALSQSLGGVKVFHIPFERKISLLKDLQTLLLLIKMIKQSAFDSVHSIMPKTGLLAMIAGFVCHIPVRIHTFTGQVWITKSGLSRWWLLSMDKLIVTLATSVMADSSSQKDILVKNSVVADSKITVLAKGSICGVDTERFKPYQPSRISVRHEYSIADNDIVILYLGRMNIEKGVLDLAKAFCNIHQYRNNVHLMLVGPDEQGVGAKIKNNFRQCLNKVHFVNYTSSPEKYMNGADIFCLPSYREGFGSVIIESAAVGIPSIATRIYGVADAIEDGVTGFLYEVKNIRELEEKLMSLIDNQKVRMTMGTAACERVRISFTKEILTQAMVEFYEYYFNKIATRK